MKSLWLVLLSAGLLWAQSVFDLSSLSKPNSTLPFSQVHHDHTGTLDLLGALEAEYQPLSRHNLGYLDHPVWIRFTLHNPSNETQRFILHSPRANTNYLDLYLIRTDQSIEHYAIGLLQPKEAKPLMHNYPAAGLILEADERLTLYARIVNFGPTEAHFILSTPTQFSLATLVESVLWGLMGGLLLGLIIYNTMIFFQLRIWIFLPYVVVGAGFLIFYYTLNGFIFILLPWLSPTPWMLLTVMMPPLILIGMVAFAMLFFQTREIAPRYHRVLQGFLLFLTGVFLLTLGADRWPEWLIALSPAVSLMMLVVVFLTLPVALIGMRHHIPGSGYYLIGQAILALSLCVTLMATVGLLTLGELFRAVAPFGVLLDLVLLSLAMGLRIRRIKEEREMDRRLLLLQSRFAAIGQTVGNITHQWKVPVVRLGTLLTEMEAHLEHKSPQEAKEAIYELLPSLHSSLSYIHQVTEDFQGFYTNDHARAPFCPIEHIIEIENLLSGKIASGMATIRISTSHESIRITNFANAFGHVMIILIDNALDIFKERQTENGTIHIDLTLTEEWLTVTVEDNGGGIRLEPIGAIFDPFVSQKLSRTSGMGLAIAMMMTKERLHGTLEAANTAKGARFTLRIPSLPQTLKAI